MDRVEEALKLVKGTSYNIPYMEYLKFLEHSDSIESNTTIKLDNNIGVMSGNFIVYSYLISRENNPSMFDIETEILIDIPISELDKEYDSNFIIDRMLKEYRNVSIVKEDYSKYILYKRKKILEKVI